MSIWMDVDTAVASAPVNILPLLDDTDFKSIEASVAYNASGLALKWNFTTTAGVTTQTAVTPTTSGSYDWTNLGGGMYAIEIPASGGGSINNDTEGFGWFSGVATGVLPWRGPIIGFRAAGLNDKIIDSAYDTTRGLAGTALPAAAAEASGGLPTLSAAQASNGTIQANVHRWLTGTPNALQSGRVDSYLGAVAAGVIAAASFASGALDAVWSTATRTLTSFGTLAQDVWDKATSALTTAGSIGKLLVDNVNATISSRMATYTQPTGFLAATFPSGTVANTTNITAGTITTVTNLTNAPTSGDLTSTMKTSVENAVWDATMASHLASGSTGEALNAAGAAGDPWITNIPGSYTGTQAGKVVGDALDATVSSRAVAGDAMTLTSGERNAIAAALLDLSNAIETGVTLRGAQRLMLAALAGKLSGAAGTTVTFRNAVADSKNRIVATVDANGNRTAITTDQT